MMLVIPVKLLETKNGDLMTYTPDRGDMVWIAFNTPQ